MSEMRIENGTFDVRFSSTRVGNIWKHNKYVDIKVSQTHWVEQMENLHIQEFLHDRYVITACPTEKVE